MMMSFLSSRLSKSASNRLRCRISGRSVGMTIFVRLTGISATMGGKVILLVSRAPGIHSCGIIFDDLANPHHFLSRPFLRYTSKCPSKAHPSIHRISPYFHFYILDHPFRMKQLLQNMKTGQTAVEEVPTPMPAAGQALVKVSASLV